MSAPKLVKLGLQIINPNTIASVHWEGHKLFVHFSAGRFLALEGESARLLWKFLEPHALDLKTGEVGAAAEVRSA